MSPVSSSVPSQSSVSVGVISVHGNRHGSFRLRSDFRTLRKSDPIAETVSAISPWGRSCERHVGKRDDPAGKSPFLHDAHPASPPADIRTQVVGDRTRSAGFQAGGAAPALLRMRKESRLPLPDPDQISGADLCTGTTADAPAGVYHYTHRYLL